MRTIRAVVIAIVTAIQTAIAQPTNQIDSPASAPSLSADQSASLYRANEVTLDVYGAYTVPEPGGIGKLLKTDLHHGKFGAGLGSTYWLSRNIGLSLDATAPALDDLSALVFDQVSLSLNARFPLGHFAPYVLAGAGRNFESDSWNTHVGAGLEWRFNRSSGVFADARYVFASREPDSLMIRSGIRFAF